MPEVVMERIDTERPTTRGGYWLRPNHTNLTPDRLIFFDTETYENKTGDALGSSELTLRLGRAHAWLRDLQEWEENGTSTFYSIPEFWEWLLMHLSSRKLTWVFTHNLCFDLTVVQFWHLLESGEWHIWQEDDHTELKKLLQSGRKPWHGLFCDKDPPTIFHARHRSGKKAVFLDTMNYWPYKVAEIGDWLHIPKLPKPHYEATDAKWERYCKRDVEVIENAMIGLINWWSNSDLGKFRYTTAALSFGSWRHRFMDRQLHRHDVPEVMQLERRSYYGGKIDLLWRGKYEGKVYEIDCNGLYPHALKENTFPLELWDWWDNPDGKGEPQLKPNFYSCADVLLKTDQPYYPFRCSEGTIWPVGPFWTTLCGPELERAIREGHVQEFGRWSCYRMGRPFVSFVEFYQKLRDERRENSDHLGVRFFKQILNALHGKLGQRSEEWKDIYVGSVLPQERRWMKINAQTRERTKYRRVGRRVQQQIPKTDHPQAIPIVAAWTTAWSRSYMDKIRAIAGQENVLYQVSDALHLTETGYRNLRKAEQIHPFKLGAFKKRSMADSAEFFAPHHYRMGENIVNGSMSAGAVPIGNDQFEELCFANLSSILASDPPNGVKIYHRTRTLNKNFVRSRPGKPGTVDPIYIKFDRKQDYELILSGKLPNLWR